MLETLYFISHILILGFILRNNDHCAWAVVKLKQASEMFLSFIIVCFQLMYIQHLQGFHSRIGFTTSMSTSQPSSIGHTDIWLL
jgi:hypothetical protein